MKKLIVMKHAQDRIRQRFGIESVSTMKSWATAKVNDGKLVRVQPDGRKVYQWGKIELIVTGDGKALVTVKDLEDLQTYAERFAGAVEKESRKALLRTERAFRKAEIHVAEITLNMLKARNPKIKASLNEKLTKADDYKEKLKTEIHVIKKAAKEHGVEL